jgi:hypothetical protein
MKQQDATIREATRFALDAVLRNQHRNGAWSQVFDGTHVRDDEPKQASYPDDWPRKHPGGDYWRHYTFNDGAMSAVIETLLEAARLYGDPRYQQAAVRGGEFILLAQMPEPQPAWAQQYDAAMHPAWARKFEPPAVSSTESVHAIETLLVLHRATRDDRFLKPIPAAIAWLQKSALPDGRFARFYELRTNKPLYLTREYELAYEPNDLPTHYSFIRGGIGLARLEREYQRELKPAAQPAASAPQAETRQRVVSDDEVRRILAALDERGAWVEQGAMRHHDYRGPIIDSATFIRNVDRLSRYVAAAKR